MNTEILHDRHLDLLLRFEPEFIRIGGIDLRCTTMERVACA